MRETVNQFREKLIDCRHRLGSVDKELDEFLAQRDLERSSTLDVSRVVAEYEGYLHTRLE